MIVRRHLVLVVALLTVGITLVGCPNRKPKLISQFTATTRISEAPLNTTFSDLSALATGNVATIDSWAWDFGDGDTSTEAAPMHTYTDPGSYTVKLTTTSGSNSSTTTLVNFVYVLDPNRTQGMAAGEEATFAGIAFVWVPAGSYMMGADDPTTATNWADAVPLHQVDISYGFWMSKYELTQKTFFGLMGINNSFFRIPFHPDSDLPVESISWVDAQALVSLLNDTYDVGLFRLPSEAEWEYACRAGTTTDFYFGDNPFGANHIDDHGWTNSNSLIVTHIVGELIPNDWGLYDMHGNVWEWTLDRYDPDYYANSPTVDPMGPDFGVYRVARGGSWYNQPYTAASPSRFPFLTTAPYNTIGVRLVLQ